MSTTVDKQKTRRIRQTATETRAQILRAAGIAFSRSGYDNVGVREIAAAAGCDPAVVIRLFGSKTELFAQVAAGAFAGDPAFEGPLGSLGSRLAELLMRPLAAGQEVEEFDDFRFLLRSAASPEAAPLLSQALHGALIAPLAARLKGDGPAARAALIVAVVLGFATMRFALGAPALEGKQADAATQHLGRAIQACVDAPRQRA